MILSTQWISRKGKMIPEERLMREMANMLPPELRKKLAEEATKRLETAVDNPERLKNLAISVTADTMNQLIDLLILNGLPTSLRQPFLDCCKNDDVFKPETPQDVKESFITIVENLFKLEESLKSFAVDEGKEQGKEGPTSLSC